ncbi:MULTISPECIES: hypothetical protein [Streptomyces]|uniref:Uncharacterized protein n=2 Tax=Streptomyces TaxID=1883 RepID=A0ABV9IV86_9ACTN
MESRMTTPIDPAQPVTPPSTEGNPPSTAPITPPSTSDVEALQAEVEKWKNLSRTNERRWNDSSAELQQLQANQEAAVEAARTEGRTSVLGEVSTELVTAELQLQAVKAGAELPDLSFLDLSRFKGDNERPNSDTVKAFVESLPQTSAGSGFPHIAGAGHNRGGNGTFSSLNPNELADYISGDSFL